MFKTYFFVLDGVAEHGFVWKCPQEGLDEMIAKVVEEEAEVEVVVVEVVVAAVAVLVVVVETDTGMFRKEFSSSFGMLPSLMKIAFSRTNECALIR